MVAQHAHHGLDGVRRADRRDVELHDVATVGTGPPSLSARRAAGSAAMTSEAITPSAPCGSAARAARRAGAASTPAQAAAHGSSPLASSAPITPDEDVARPGGRERGRAARRDGDAAVGRATSVSSPLRTTIAPGARGGVARVAQPARARSRPTSTPEQPRRARRRAGSARSAPGACASVLEAPGERVEAVGVEHERHGGARASQGAREGLRAGRPPEARAERRARRPRARSGLERRLDARLGERRRPRRAARASSTSSSRTAKAIALERRPARTRSRSPAPARIAACAAMAGAPVRPAEPPTTTTCPLVNFVEPAPAARDAVEHAPARAGRRRPAPGPPRGMPMSMTRTSPARALARRDPQAGLGLVEGRGRGRAHRGARRPRPWRRRRRSGRRAAIDAARRTAVDAPRSPRAPARAARR